jgi:hypothetical protein
MSKLRQRLQDRPLSALLLFACLLLFLGSFVWAGSQGSVLAALADIAATPWGAVTLFDLAVGLLLVACWVWFIEPRRWLAVLVTIGLFTLGNFATVAYLLLRLIEGKPLLGLARD